MKIRASIVLCLLAGCASQEVKKEVPPPQLPDQDLKVVSQNLTDFDVAVQSKITCSEALTLKKATFELVIDGKVTASGEKPLTGTCAPDAPGAFSVDYKGKYVANADELKAMDGRGGSLLIALRGKAFFEGPSGPVSIDYAHSRELRVPRLPHPRFQEVEAGRSAEDEAVINFRIGVYNPNPFEVLVSSISYDVQIAGKKVTDGVIGKGERVSPASTGVFDVEAKVGADTHGDKEVRALIKSRVLPYTITGEMKADLFSEPYDFKGNINLPPSK
jgi:hypothetical protein